MTHIDDYALITEAKMSDNKPVFVVPVDPKTYGLGMAIGCLIKFWPIFLVMGLIMGGIFGVSMTASNAKSTRQANEQATENASYFGTQAAARANVEDKIAALKRLRDNKQGLLLEIEIGASQICGDHMTIHTLEFADDGVRLYFDASMINNSNDDVAGSWLIWNPDQFNLNHGSNGGIEPIATQMSQSSPNTTCDSPVSGTLPVEHFTGFLVYPYANFFDANRSEDGILYMALGYSSEYKDSLFVLLDINHSESWDVISARK